MEGGEDALEEADREADLLERMPLPGHPQSEKERPASWLRLPRRARRNQTVTSKSATLTERSTRANKTKYQCFEDISMSGL